MEADVNRDGDIKAEPQRIDLLQRQKEILAVC